MRAWMRVLTITLTSKLTKRAYVFGDNQQNFAISVNGYKYASALKDSCTIEIKNLSYYQILDIINGKYFDVEIKAGYKDANIITIFKGAVLYITNQLETDKTHTAIILCGSNLIAKYMQNRLNLSLNSSVNVYSAIKFLASAAGIDTSKIQVDKSMIQTLSNDITNVSTTYANFIEMLVDKNPNYIVSTDASLGSDLTIYDIRHKSLRNINMNNEWILLTGGYPRLTSEGLRLTVLPTIDFVCGDTIKIDNAIINIYASNMNEANQNYAYYLDKEGQYLLYEVAYRLENRGSSFEVELFCKSLSLTKGLYGNG